MEGQGGREGRGEKGKTEEKVRQGGTGGEGREGERRGEEGREGAEGKRANGWMRRLRSDEMILMSNAVLMVGSCISGWYIVGDCGSQRNTTPVVFQSW